MNIKDLFKFFEVPEDLEGKELKDFVTLFNEKYIPKKTAHENPEIKSAIIGEFTTPLNRQVKKTFTYLKPEDLENKNIGEIFDIIHTTHTTTENELKKQLEDLKKANPDEKFKNLTAELETYKGKAAQFEADLMNKNREIETIKNESLNQIKSFKIGLKLNEIRNKLPIRDDLSELEKEGFEVAIGKSFKFDLDDKDNLLVFNANGEKIQNEKKTDYLQPLEALTIFAVEKKALKQNNAGEGQRQTIPTTNGTQVKKGNERFIHENYRH